MIQLADFAKPLLTKKKRYKVLYGGRGSGKSYAVADALLIKAATEQHTILCTREYQNSMKDSVHSLLRFRIVALGLEDHFHITNDEIRCINNGSKFLFYGCRYNVQSIKSIPALTIIWIEEAATISRSSFNVLKPTLMRNEGAELWVTFNPENEDDVVYEMFVLNPPEDSYIIKISYLDNPWLSNSALQTVNEDMARLDPDEFNHIWHGEIRKISDAQVFKNKYVIQEFEPDYTYDYPLYGMDFGFSQDPTTAVEIYIKDNDLYIYREACKVGLEINHTADYIKQCINDIDRYVIEADSARPETISYLQNHGLPLINGVKKWAGSVQDGVSFMRSFNRIIIHPKCEHTIYEFKNYSYKTDNRTGNILPDVLDKHNHMIDAIRYALVNLITQQTVNYAELL